MKQKKYLFIDRDGTLIAEPSDEQVDHIEKLNFLNGVFTALSRLQQAGYELVMVSNQDGLGTPQFPQITFEIPHKVMLKVFQSQGIQFLDVRVCPHFADQECECRKPKIGLLLDYVTAQSIDKAQSYVIGDRDTDLKLAKNLGINGIQISDSMPWERIADEILNKPRSATVKRKTNETNIELFVNLDQSGAIHVATGIHFFNHMLEQIIKHANISATINVQGDIAVDDHHSVEDTAIALGEAIRQALGDKRGIGRYGFVLPMDESQATVSLDLSGRAFCQWECEIDREKVGDMATEMVPHFFKSLADSLQATLHIRITGNNTHHKIEAAFKAVGRVLRQAIQRENNDIPSTKGML